MSSATEPASVGPIESAEATGLRGNMGVIELIFTVVAYNGPVVVFLGFIPAMILLGNGVGTPVVILVCGVVIALVAVGLIKMASRLDKPGGFYALITAGLGRVPGLAAGFTALTCYFVALISVYALGGIALNGVVHGLFRGPDISWKVWAFVILAIASTLGYFNISASSKILTVFLFCELVLMAAYDLSVLVRGGAHGIHFASFTHHEIFSGSISIAFLFGIGLFGGFEATVIFRDEVKNPRRTIPAATYGVVALLAGMYGLTSWCFINSFGAPAVMDVLNSDLTGAPTESIKHYTGTFAYDLATIMLFTSSFALVLAAHNITSRYLFNLGADGIFSRRLGVAHPRHVSPHRASVVVSVASLITLVIFIVAKVPSEDLYARLAGMYSYAFVMLLALVALAIGVFLLRERVNGPAVGPALSSLVAFVIICITLVLATKNFTLLTGATGTVKAVLLIVIWGVTAAGVVTAVALRSKRPEVYARIGRQQPGSGL